MKWKFYKERDRRERTRDAEENFYPIFHSAKSMVAAVKMSLEQEFKDTLEFEQALLSFENIFTQEHIDNKNKAFFHVKVVFSM